MAQFGPESVAHFAPEWVAYFAPEWVAQFGPEYADSQPHFTTFARFIAEMGDVVQSLFTQVLMVCDQEGLIGGHMFAIDGCKMPSNASR